MNPARGGFRPLWEKEGAIWLGLAGMGLLSTAALLWNLEPILAWQGYSPLLYVYKACHPEFFARDFPGGTQLFDLSLFMRFYRWAYQWFGIPPETMLPPLIGLPILFLGVAFYYLGRKVLGQDSPQLLAVVVVLAVASSARNMNLAKYGAPPEAWGSVLWYNACEGLRLLALAWVLSKRYVWAALALGLCFAVVPTQALMGGLFIAIMLLTPPVQLPPWKKSLGYLGLLALICLAWLLWAYKPSLMGDGLLPAKDYFAYTSLSSFHYYPISSGHFTWLYSQGALQFLTFGLLCLHYLSRGPLSDTDRRLVTAMLGMLALCLAGIMISHFQFSVFLLKLTLHRANDLFIVFGLFFVTRGLWQDICDGPASLRLAALLLLLSPCFGHVGYPPGLAVLVVLLGVLQDRGSAPLGGQRWWALGFCLFLAAYVTVGLVRGWDTVLMPVAIDNKELGLFGNFSLWLAGIVSLFACDLAGLLRRRLEPRRLIQTVALVCCLLASCWWLWSYRVNSHSQQTMEVFQEYLEVQRWAKDNTPRDSLFMVEPTMSYGWPDYAWRSSFGVLHSWLLVGWVYNQDSRTFQMGLERFQEFGLDLGKYLQYPSMRQAWNDLRGHVRKVFYDGGDQFWGRLAQKYGINYFVLTKSHMRKRTSFRVVFENQVFLVVAPAP